MKAHAATHASEHIVHLAITREKTKRPAPAVLQQLHNFICCLRCETGVADVRHFGWQIQQSLFGVIELRRQVALFDVVEAETLANEFEPAADRKRRGS